jgi:hypothetical protein
LGSDLNQAKTKGEKRFDVRFSKVTGNWSVKPVKEQKDHSIFTLLITRAVQVVENK